MFEHLSRVDKFVLLTLLDFYRFQTFPYKYFSKMFQPDKQKYHKQNCIYRTDNLEGYLIAVLIVKKSETHCSLD